MSGEFMMLKKNRILNKKRAMEVLMLASIFIIGFYFLWDFICSNKENYSVPISMVNETRVYTTRKSENTKEIEASEKDKIQEPHGLYAQSAVLMDAKSGRILFEKNGGQKRAMASTTKIMTCILALEYGDLDDVVIASSNAVNQPKVRLGVVEGEEILLRDLLYSLMLESHNDAAVMLAEHIGGSVEGFADMMNQKAQRLGCKNTYFITPNGLDASDENGSHQTTAEELARIMKYCIQDSAQAKQFLAISQTETHHFEDCSHVYKYTCNNHNAFLKMMEGAIAGKTGFTGEAGYCYVGALEQNDKKLIVALLGCGWPNNKGYKWQDTRKLMQYGLDSFEYVMIEMRNISKELADIKIPVVKGVPANGKISGESYTKVWMKNMEEGENTDSTELEQFLLRKDQKIHLQIVMKKQLYAPVEAKTEVGEIQYLLDGNVIKRQTVIVKNMIERRDYQWCVRKTVETFLL